MSLILFFSLREQDWPSVADTDAAKASTVCSVVQAEDTVGNTAEAAARLWLQGRPSTYTRELVRTVQV